MYQRNALYCILVDVGAGRDIPGRLRLSRVFGADYDMREARGGSLVLSARLVTDGVMAKRRRWSFYFKGRAKFGIMAFYVIVSIA